MNKNVILIFVLCFLLTNSFAQSPNKETLQFILGIADFSASNEQQAKFTNVLKERVTDMLNQTGRFHLVDIDGTARNQSLEKSKVNYKSDNWIDDKKSLNAEYTLTAFIGNLKFIKLNGGKGYKATITYTLKIMNTENGSYINNGTQTFSSLESKVLMTPETALQDAINTTQEILIEYIKNSFPIKVRIAKIKEIKNGTATYLIINGGFKNGIEEGQKFLSKFIDYSLGSAYPTEIGKIKISKVVNDNFSEAKVLSGGDLILQHFSTGNDIVNEIITEN